MLSFAFISLFLHLITLSASIFFDQAFYLLWSLCFLQAPRSFLWGHIWYLRRAWGLASHPSQPSLLSCLPQSKRCCCCLGSLEESSDLYTWKITRWLKRGQSYSLSSVREEWVMGNDRCCDQNQRLYYSLIGIPPHVREILGCASLPLCSVGKCWIDLSAQNIGA